MDLVCHCRPNSTLNLDIACRPAFNALLLCWTFFMTPLTLFVSYACFKLRKAASNCFLLLCCQVFNDVAWNIAFTRDTLQFMHGLLLPQNDLFALVLLLTSLAQPQFNLAVSIQRSLTMALNPSAVWTKSSKLATALTMAAYALAGSLVIVVYGVTGVLAPKFLDDAWKRKFFSAFIAGTHTTVVMKNNLTQCTWFPANSIWY